MKKKLLLIVIPLVFLCVSSCCKQKTGHTTWSVYGGGPDNTRYSSLKQINRDNVKQLQVVWTFDTEDAGGDSEMECNPIIVGRTLYATTPRSNVIALDAATGKLRWRFDPWDKQPFQFLYNKVRNRGVTYWSDGDKDRRIFVAARQYLYALNADTGKPIETFGSSGHLDLREDLG